MPDPAELHRLCESYCDLRWHLDPVEASEAGVSAHDGRLGVFTVERVREHLAALRALGSAVEALEVEALDDEIDRTALLSHLRVEDHRWRVERPHERDPGLWVQQVLDGLHQLLLVHDRDPRSVATAVRARLEAVPGVLAAAQGTLRDCPWVLLDAALDGLEGGEGLVRDVEATLGGASDPALETAAVGAREALVAFAAHLAGMRRTVDPDAAIGVGREALTFRLRHQHAVPDSTEALLRWTGTCIAEIERQLGDQARVLGTDPWPEVLARLRRDHAPPGTLVACYADAVERCRTHVVARSLATVPDGPLAVLATPRFARPWVPVAGYLPAGPMAADRTGRLFVTEPDPGAAPAGHGRHAVAAAAAHEGFPGHHLQFGVARTQDRVVRRLLSFPIGVEGWGLYAEEVMRETGFYAIPEERLLQLSGMLWRAVRVPLDVGIHTGALTFDGAVRLMQERAHASRPHAVAEVRRACAMPGYPSSYAIGQRELLALRAARRNAAGSAYSDRTFHDTVLAYGGLPQALVRWGMERHV